MSENVQTTPLHVLGISNGIVNLPEYILIFFYFQLEKNEIVVEYSFLAILSKENSIFFYMLPPPKHPDDVPASEPNT